MAASLLGTSYDLLFFSSFRLLHGCCKMGMSLERPESASPQKINVTIILNYNFKHGFSKSRIRLSIFTVFLIMTFAIFYL